MVGGHARRIIAPAFGQLAAVYGSLRELACRFAFRTIHDVERMINRERAGCEASPPIAAPSMSSPPQRRDCQLPMMNPVLRKRAAAHCGRIGLIVIFMTGEATFVA